MDNTGTITHDNLRECFRRQGRQVSEGEIDSLMSQVPAAEEGKITFEEYTSFMTELLQQDENLDLGDDDAIA